MELKLGLNKSAVTFGLIVFLCYSVLALDTRSECVQGCMDKVLYGKSKDYQDCMKWCLSRDDKRWPLNRATDCELSDYYSDLAPACSANQIQVVSRSKNLTSSRTGVAANREFIAVAWTPCPYGISDVAGYEVTLLETEFAGFAFCKKVTLRERLNSSNINEQLSVLFADHELDYSTNYQIWIEGLPTTSHRHRAYTDYMSLPCTHLNGAGSCECGLNGFEALPPASFEIRGYTVFVSIKVLDECFGVHTYVLSLLHSTNSTVTALQTITIKLSQHAPYENYTFYYVYPNSELLLQYRAFSSHEESRASDVVILDIHEWKANILSVSNEENSVTVTWKCAEKSYNISSYQIKLSYYIPEKFDVADGTVQDVENTCNGNETTISKTFVSLKSGTYAVQIREYRPPSPYTRNATWSEVGTNSTFTIRITKKLINDGDFIAAAAIVFPAVVILVSCLVVFYCCKKGYCEKIRHQIPFSFDFLLNTESSFKHSSKTVWLVWQTDTRSDALQELHSENVRHVASFFSNQCGLNVLLDQYDLQSCTNLSVWIQEKNKEAEVIIFICPHFEHQGSDMNSDDICTNRFMGNFFATYRFYENTLLNERATAKFISVLLPYHEKNSCSATELLLKRTPVFKLMDDIEDLYFYIQGCPKVHRFGRHIVKNIHRDEYHNTSEGKALQIGIQKMLQQQNSDSSLSEESETNMQSVLTEMEQLLPEVRENYIDPVRPEEPQEEFFLNKARSFIPNPPPPVIQDEDADSSMFLINAQDLLSFHYLANNAVQAFNDEAQVSIQPQQQYTMNVSMSVSQSYGDPDNCSSQQPLIAESSSEL